MKVKRPFGKTSKLWCKRRRVREYVRYLNEIQFLSEFMDLLPTNSKDILIHDSEAPYSPSTYIEWDKLQCRKCRLSINRTEEFVHHMLKCQFEPIDEKYYRKYGVISKTAQEVLEEAQSQRASNSYLVKSFANTTDYICTIPLKSPLAIYIWKGISIYYDKPPSNLKKVVPSILHISRKSHKVYFTAKLIERQIDEVLKNKEQNQQKRELRELRRVCSKFNITTTDVVLSSTNRRTRADLLKALGFNKNVKNEEIMKVVNQMKKNCEGVARQRGTTKDENEKIEEEDEEIPVVDEVKLTAATKNLTSDLTSNFLLPSAPKRIPISRNLFNYGSK